jgi:hypothetical protein
VLCAGLPYYDLKAELAYRLSLECPNSIVSLRPLSVLSVTPLNDKAEFITAETQSTLEEAQRIEVGHYLEFLRFGSS